EVIGRRDLRVERIDARPQLLRTIVAVRGASSLRGQIAVTRIAANAVVPIGSVRAPAAKGGLRAMSIPIDPALAAGGALAAGDHVDIVFRSRDAASIIVADAEVLAVDARGRGGIGETSSPFVVTIAVDARQSLLLGAAIADGHISIARTTGAPSSAGTSPQPLERLASGTSR